eukprot:scaffold43208_cov74-Phaeocystis_antarctica.AAC.1
MRCLLARIQALLARIHSRAHDDSAGWHALSSPAVRSSRCCYLASQPPPPARCCKGDLRTLRGRAPPTAAIPRRPRPAPRSHPCIRHRSALRQGMPPRAAQSNSKLTPTPADPQ